MVPDKNNSQQKTENEVAEQTFSRPISSSSNANDDIQIEDEDETSKSRISVSQLLSGGIDLSSLKSFAMPLMTRKLEVENTEMRIS